MLFTAPDIARRLEAAEALHVTRQAGTYARLHPDSNARTVAIGSGVAIVTDAAFGRKLNHVVGLGMGSPITPDDLVAIERLYHPRGLPAEIDLCPHADSGALDVLVERGYRVNAFSNSFGRVLSDADLAPPASPGIEIRRVDAALAELFIAECVAGFSVQAQRRPAALLEILARIALERADTTLFLALIGGTVAGSAGTALLETADGPVAHLHIASTRPDHRGRGVQAALLQARLADARRAGLDLASISVRPTNTSARNAERAGFRLAFTKPTFSRPPPP
ncbi:MAG TPA: GNAT family N-acetyltransferase [Aliidongia sp.]|uniref:GNAT family N-acetyltransferase n=1 Tax=Aliidongia sp. TaxID=1914230 RepID=UPI002DDCB05C|nr:GNAT family N-acetyltransferase [Aliidongia sp.]HEV2676280.1 GNAT family N-acetyltransferase [Aliidongia sp.]